MKAADEFEREVFPILQKHCLACHGPEKRRAGLRVDVKKVVFEATDARGAAIIPGRSGDSPIYRLAAGLDDDAVMPPNDEGKPTLTEPELSVLRAWIDAGARWPDGVGGTVEDPGRHWAFHPLHRPDPPRIEAADVRNPVDAFLEARLREKGVALAGPADRRAWIRRLSFDLLGLPPTVEEVDAYLADAAPDADERLVDRMLASPRYGERFARLWLDVVHFGESHGFGMDRPRNNAWPYRDYVINAFNADTPYARFVQEQIAADALFPDEPAKTPALGFAAAGPFNQSALVEQTDGTECKKIALNLDRDDMAASVASTFLSLTVQCARCHDHKFDPIPQTDYYRLQAVFAGVGRAEREYDADPEIAARRKALVALKAVVASGSVVPAESEEERRRLDESRGAWEVRSLSGLGSWITLWPSEAKAESGAPLAVLEDGSILAKGPIPAVDAYTLTTAPPAGTKSLRLEVLTDDSLPAHGPGRAENGNLTLTEWKALAVAPDGSTKPVALKGPAADFQQVDQNVARAFDGNDATGWAVHPEVGKPHFAVVDLAEDWAPAPGTSLRIVMEQKLGRQHVIGRFRLSASSLARPAADFVFPADVASALTTPIGSRTADQEATLTRHHRRVDVDRRLGELPATNRVFAIASSFPAYRNYKPPGEPYPIRVLKRGDVGQPGDAVSPGALGCIAAVPSVFNLEAPGDEKARRAALARWITDPANPLTWRSMANRVWQWHFGVGLVDTPNDFGKNGSVPSHPELLDWLAATLRDDGSLKNLHRLIVTSAAYRRSSGGRAWPEDSDNRLLSRMNRRRLDAEQVRDGLLAVSGRLDFKMGGPSAKQFVYSDPNVEVSPRIDYVGFDPDAPESLRRGVYRFLFRNVSDPLLEAFDAADPSLPTPRRNSTITPQQSLSLWNGRFALRQCEHLAARLEREAPDLEARVELACRLAWGRPPEAGELALLRGHAERHGLANACRLVLNANDFLFVH
ncbi:PSD1 and planctomycete cytochrome C domain-containing protein [Paludisphaera mucosa]|uniref:PSD1 and planctomycete cytochrome C domain-containing protein n=1 Tax=Paludisphaera mucosa TaxID=3030827 RepID=A0ABT6F8B4_9BACT|nr:PSD1 and planctomycete cytochrome C domain-containing protein [Paludisphaera mucosa]